MAMISTQTMGDTEERLGVQQPQTRIVTGSVVAPSEQSEKYRRYLGRIKTCHQQVASFQERGDKVFQSDNFCKKKLQQNQGHHVKGLETRIYEHQRY